MPVLSTTTFRPAKLERCTMRIRALVATLLTLCSLAGSAAGQEGQAPDTVVLHGVNIVDVEAGSIASNQTVVLADGRVQSIGAGEVIPENAISIQAAGKFLIPGLWDMHVHLRSPLAPTILMPQFIAHGVTGVRDMSSDCNEASNSGICASHLRSWSAEVEAGERLGPRIVALSSMPINPPWEFEVTESFAKELVGRLAKRDLDFIKVYYRLSPEGLRLIAAEAKKAGLEVGGHISLRMTAAEASDAGLRSLEHARDFLFDCFPGSADFRSTTQSQNPPIELRRQMVEQHDKALCARTFKTFVENDTWYVPTHVTRRMDAFADDEDFRSDPRQKFIPSMMWSAWQADADSMVALDSTPEGRLAVRRFYEEGLAITGRAFAAGVPIALGTDAGDTYVFPGSAVHDELGELHKAGLTPAQALAAATIRAAEFLKMEKDYGSVAVGKHADLVLLNANPLEDIENVRQIHAVVLGGRVLDRAELDEVLQDVEKRVAAFGGK